MGNSECTCPLTQKELLDRYFMEYRAKIIDVAAFLDRMDRAAQADAVNDFRFRAFLKSLHTLSSEGRDRARDVLMVLSDPRLELLDERDQQNADGASAADHGE